MLIYANKKKPSNFWKKIYDNYLTNGIGEHITPKVEAMN